MKKIWSAGLAVALGTGIALGAAGCSTTRYEDCEVADQFLDGDTVLRQQVYESDCGYWERDGDYFLREALVVGAVWHWWSWVTPGVNSFPPKNWKPPHGLKPPKESKSSEKRRKQYERKTTTNQKPASTTKNQNVPKTGTGNQGIPKGNTAPKAPAYKPPPRFK